MAITKVDNSGGTHKFNRLNTSMRPTSDSKKGAHALEKCKGKINYNQDARCRLQEVLQIGRLKDAKCR